MAQTQESTETHFAGPLIARSPDWIKRVTGTRETPSGYDAYNSKCSDLFHHLVLVETVFKWKQSVFLMSGEHGY